MGYLIRLVLAVGWPGHGFLRPHATWPRARRLRRRRPDVRLARLARRGEA